ncbi:HTH-type transcriptional regulator CynR [compost metagenome]
MVFSPTDVSYFLEVVRTGHLGRAAAACGVTQPTITKAIHRLEDAIGVSLLERGAQGARLTADGHLFLEFARRFHSQHQEMVRAARDLRAQHAGLLRVGITNPAGDPEAVWAMSEMVRQRPGLRLKLTIGKSDALNAAVEGGELDLAVVPSYPGVLFSCMQTVISEDRVMPVARAHHPLRERQSPTLHDLAKFSWVMPSRESAGRRAVTEIFDRAGLAPPTVVLEVDYMSEAAMAVVASTDLLGLARGSTIRNWMGRVIPLSLASLSIQRTIVLLTRPQSTWSPLMAAFRDLLLAYRAPRSGARRS